jgi:hypothetical protein
LGSELMSFETTRLDACPQGLEKIM